MEGNYLTAGDLAMYENARDGHNCGCGYDRYCHSSNKGVAATGLALGASGLGIAIFGGLALAYGLNSASKARARGAENAIAQQNKTLEVLANVVNREATRQDSINLDVTQTQRAQAGALAQGGSATSQALATAEALALLQNNSNSGLNSAIGGCNFLRVARYSAPQPCPCDSCCNG